MSVVTTKQKEGAKKATNPNYVLSGVHLQTEAKCRCRDCPAGPAAYIVCEKESFEQFSLCSQCLVAFETKLGGGKIKFEDGACCIQ